MNRPWKIWLVFALCSAVLVAVMGWVSATALRLERAQAQAQHQADLEEKVRLALWRMDSMLAPLVAQESARPYFTYSAFYAAERAYGRMYNQLEPGEVFVPSPLLRRTSSHVLLHFQFDPERRLTSPEVPDGNQRDLAEVQFTTHEKIEAAAGRLKQFEQIMAQPAAATLAQTTQRSTQGWPTNAEVLLAAVLTAPADANLLLVNAEPADSPALPQRLPAPQSKGSQPADLQQSQVARSGEEQQARAQSIQLACEVNLKNNDAEYFSTSRVNVAEGLVRPLWFGDSLVLARRVVVQGRDYVQGCWLDWPGLRQWLLDGVKDLLPAATLESLGRAADNPRERMLAALPVRLVAGQTTPGAGPLASPILFALALAWFCVLVAGIAVALLLRGTLTLSERRAAFVSSVTHELRTPLTTFKMYSEMLAEGLVGDPDKRKQYLDTLCAEANRLNHLVENVLAYARLERGGPRRRIEQVTLRELIKRVKPRLVQRVEQAGMSLQEDADPRALGTVVEVDVSAVEQILFNLVDNACKHAAPSAGERIPRTDSRLESLNRGQDRVVGQRFQPVRLDRQDAHPTPPENVIYLEALPDSAKFALLRVRDHGQGISAEAARHLFQPFSKSAQEAAHTAPGVGLGLALSRRLSRSLGGDLRFNGRITGGACFEMLIPATPPT